MGFRPRSDGADPFSFGDDDQLYKTLRGVKITLFGQVKIGIVLLFSKFYVI
jgi:hypothetical protein